ncbi:MAG TPA: hypothetical protein VMT85_17590 [Thermoanaerobaculia bacterium]|nr:hypothetical protein [Thermoanaerobaculia bacterium]
MSPAIESIAAAVRRSIPASFLCDEAPITEASANPYREVRRL